MMSDRATGCTGPGIAIPGADLAPATVVAYLSVTPPAGRHLVAGGQLLLIVDDVNCGLLGGGCASVDTDVISHQVCLLVLAKTLVRRDKSTSSRASNLIMLRKFGLTLGFVGALLLVLVVRVVYLHRRVRLFLGKKLVQAFGSRIEGGTSVWPLGRRISLVKYVVDPAIDEGVLRLKLVVLIHAVFAIRSTHDSTMSLHPGSAMVRVSRG